MAGVLQGSTLANFSWNLLDELSVLVPLSDKRKAVCSTKIMSIVNPAVQK
jgi:hypothetical protein